MRIFVDSASLSEISQAFAWGICDGVTTNPSLIRKAVAELKDESMESYIRKILVVAGEGRPVSLEVTQSTSEGMLKEGLALYKRFNGIANNVVVKIPVNPSMQEGDGKDFDGIAVIRTLAQQGIPVNCTLVFTPMQALLAAKAGALMVSPFAGRVDDFLRTRAELKFGKDEYFGGFKLRDGEWLYDEGGSMSGVDLCYKIKHIFREYGLSTQVLGASVRNARQMAELAAVGCDIQTVPFSVLKTVMRHPKTYEGMRLFTDDVVPEYEDLLNKDSTV